MRPKSLILLVLALGCGLVAAIGVSQLMANRSSGPPVADRETVCVVIQDIARGTYISAEMVKLEQWPRDVIPVTAIRSVEDVLDQHARTTLLAGQPILEGHLGSQRAAGTIEPGKRLIPIQVDEVRGVAQMIQPGDHVDVLVLLEQGNDFAETTVSTILQNATIFAVDSNFTSEGTEPGQATRARTVTLELTPEEAQIVTMAADKGRLQLVLRHPNDNRTVDVGLIGPGSLHTVGAADDPEPDPVVSMLASTLSSTIAKLEMAVNPDAHSVWVVKSRINEGDPIRADQVKLERWAGSTLPAGAMQNLEDIVGLRTRGNMFPGQPVLKGMLVDYDGGTIPITIKEGNRAIPIEVTEASGLAFMLHPGDHVDVHLFVRTEGETETGKKVENMHVKTILQDVLVFAAGDTHTIKTGEEGKTIEVKTVTLELTPEQTQLVALAQGMAQDNKGSLQLSLRHPEDDARPDLAPINFAEVFGPMLNGEEENEEEESVFSSSQADESAIVLAAETIEVDVPGWHVVGKNYLGEEISDQKFPYPSQPDITPTQSDEDTGSQSSPQETTPDDASSGSLWNWGRSLIPEGDEEQDNTETEPSEDEPESTPDATIDQRVGARQGVERS